MSALNTGDVSALRVKEIKAELKKRKIPFGGKARKPELVKLLKKHIPEEESVVKEVDADGSEDGTAETVSTQEVCSCRTYQPSFVAVLTASPG